MYRYGVRIYFDKDGSVVAQIGQIETTTKDYYEQNDPREWHPALIGKEEIEMQQFEWDDYASEFSTQKLTRIDPKTRQPVFEPWPEPDPSTDPPPLPESEFDKLRRQMAEQDVRIGDVELGLAEIFAGGGE